MPPLPLEAGPLEIWMPHCFFKTSSTCCSAFVDDCLPGLVRHFVLSYEIYQRSPPDLAGRCAFCFQLIGIFFALALHLEPRSHNECEVEGGKWSQRLQLGLASHM